MNGRLIQTIRKDNFNHIVFIHILNFHSFTALSVIVSFKLFRKVSIVNQIKYISLYF